MATEAAFDAAPTEPASRRMQHLYADCNTATGMIYTDPTRKFLTPSVSGYKYMFVVYNYDGKYTHSEPTIYNKGPSIIAAYKSPSNNLNLADSNPSSNDSTIRHHWPFSLSWMMLVLNSNCHHSIAIAATPQSEQFTLLKITSLLDCAPPTATLPYTFDTKCYPKASLP
jgi:hypothetical protein